ncbi:hypothetical protein [Desulfosudis oleivorans]|uniref:hypothetical protein n=1 Tax=Desulfosudis oleivorans TaxID=181663 RepID=UPI00059BECF2|nr:hypothetical protein [Desulfosudis oleivorans]
MHKNNGEVMMNFEEFQAWLINNFNQNTERRFDTLGGRSCFYVRYNSNSKVVSIKRSTGNQGQLNDDQIRKVFERYNTGSQSERDMTSFYTDTYWENTPDRILAPYVAAVIKTWGEKGQ